MSQESSELALTNEAIPSEAEEKQETGEQAAKEKQIFRMTPATIHLILSSVFASLGIFTVLFYIFGPGVGYMHSDCTDTILWAQASYDSGKWISPYFYYAAQLPFGGNLLMLPLIPLFGVSVMTHNLGMTLFMILFVFSIFMACRAAGLSMAYRLDCIGLSLLIISSSEKMWEIFWGHVIYYSLGAMLLFFGFAILISLERRYLEKKLTWYAQALAAFYFMCVTLDGSQMMILVTVPLLGGFFLERFFDAESKWNCRENKAFGILTILLMVASLLGLIWFTVFLNAKTAGYANAYSVWSNMNEWSQHLLDLPNAWFKLFGLEVYNREDMFSLISFSYLLRLVTSLVIALLPIGLLIRYKQIKDRPLKIFLWSHLILSASIVFAFVFGLLYTANWRLSPIIASGLVLLIMTIGYEIKHRGVAQRLVLLATVPLLLTAFMNAGVILGKGFYYNRDKAIYQVADFLEKNDLTYGYASFWNSQLLTVYTGEAVKARNVSFDENGLHHENYQTATFWFGPQEGVDRYFVLMSQTEYRNWRKSLSGQEELKNVLETYPDVNGFVILVFDHDL